MAAFTNTATLTYNNKTKNSNVVTGELLEVLTATKSVIGGTYRENDMLTYVVTLVNSGTTATAGLTVTDNLGEYTFGTGTLVPLTYVDGSIKYYENGVLKTAPAVTPGPPLTISGITVPAGGNAVLIYQARVNEYAPTTNESVITNTATVTGGIQTITATATATARTETDLAITKTLCPQTIIEDGRVTYTFIIQNSGNLAAVAADNISVSDTFDPVLSDLEVTLDGMALASPADYTYNETTGEFATVPGRITVPAATRTQKADGTYVVTPGNAVLVITGTI